MYLIICILLSQREEACSKYCEGCYQWSKFGRSIYQKVCRMIKYLRYFGKLNVIKCFHSSGKQALGELGDKVQGLQQLIDLIGKERLENAFEGYVKN